MINAIDSAKMLKVFQKIREHGKKVEDGFTLNGVSASNDFDGYTVYLSDKKVTLTLFFHSKYALESPNKIDEQAFFEKLATIEKAVYTR